MCSRCKRQYEYDKKRGHTRTVCNSCTVSNRRFILKEKSLEYKGGECERCGYCKSKRALTFHHIDPSQKEFGISGNHSRSWESIKEELDKCMLLCMNCHMEVHEEIDEAARANLKEIREEELKKFEARMAPKQPKPLDKCPQCDNMKDIKLKHCSTVCATRATRKVDWESVDVVELVSRCGSIEAAGREVGVSGNAVKKQLIRKGAWIKRK